MEANKVTEIGLENQLMSVEYLIRSENWNPKEEKIVNPFEYRKDLSAERMNEILKMAIQKKGILSFEGKGDELIIYLNGERI